MDAKELWEETVRQMREDAEFEDESVMYAQGEIDRLRAENERAMCQSIVDQQRQVWADAEIDRLRAENEKLRTALGGMLRSYFLVINDPLMEQRNSLRAFILGVFSGDPQAATDALAIAPTA